MSLQVFKYSTALEKHKLFISGLPFSCTKQELEKICKAHGTVKELRLVTNRAGKPKVCFLGRGGAALLTQGGTLVLLRFNIGVLRLEKEEPGALIVSLCFSS